MESDWKGYTHKDYEKLGNAYKHALMVCPPDEYQYRQNRLSYAIAEFLLLPAYKFSEDKE